jgi:hypothetical protein
VARQPDTTRDDKSPPAQPTARQSTAPGTEARLAVRRTQPGDFGHNADYSFLQGILSKNRAGSAILRYCDELEQDPWGGQVRLVEDRRLNAFQDGDVIAVEGEFIRDPNSPTLRYRIRAVRLVRLAGAVAAPP